MNSDEIKDMSKLDEALTAFDDLDKEKPKPEVIIEAEFQIKTPTQEVFDKERPDVEFQPSRIQYQPLRREDELWIARHIPKPVIAILKNDPKLMIAGGFIRALLGREKPSDIDIFGPDPSKMKYYADELAGALEADVIPAIIVLPENKKDDDEEEDPDGIGYGPTLSAKKKHTSVNAVTVKGPIPIQFIHKWKYETPEQILDAFDYGISRVVVWLERERTTGRWRLKSLCHPDFYSDLSMKRLTFNTRVISTAGSSLLRMLKFYQRGYRMPLKDLANLVAAVSAQALKRDEFREVKLMLSQDQISSPENIQRLSRSILETLTEIDPQFEDDTALINSANISFLPSDDEEDFDDEEDL